MLKGMELVYWFQIKEYRFDRLFSQINEVGFFHFFYSFSFKLSKKSMRNFIIYIFYFSLVVSLFLYSLEQISLYYFLAYSFLFAPIFAFLIISLGVILTSIPSFLIVKFSQFKARRLVKTSKAKFIGVTGSYGKTSTKEFLYQVLSRKFKVGKTEENMNTAVGIAFSINKNLTPDTQYFIVETGAYKKGEIEEAVSYIRFEKIILTGLGNQHLSLYGSRDNLIEEESRPLLDLSPENTAYVNSKVPNINAIRNINTNIVTYGSGHNDNVKLKNIHASAESSSGQIEYKKSIFNLHTKLIGAHFLENLMPVVAIAYDLGLKKEKIENFVNEITPINGKLSKHSGYGGATILFDGVNSNLDGFISAIKTMESFLQKNKIIMTQGIIELGIEKKDSYDKLISLIEKLDIKLFTTDSLFSKISENKNIFTFNDVSNLTVSVKKRLNRGTLLLIEGKFPKKYTDSILNENK